MRSSAVLIRCNGLASFDTDESLEILGSGRSCLGGTTKVPGLSGDRELSSNSSFLGSSNLSEGGNGDEVLVALNFVGFAEEGKSDTANWAG